MQDTHSQNSAASLESIVRNGIEHGVSVAMAKIHADLAIMLAQGARQQLDSPEMGVGQDLALDETAAFDAVSEGVAELVEIASAREKRAR